MLNKYIRIFTIVGMTMVVSSCTEELTSVTGNLEMMTFRASTEHKSKAEFSDQDYPSIIWQQYDKVSIIGQLTGNQPFTTESSGSEVEFEGLADSKDDTFYAVYPHQTSAGYPTEEEKSKAPDVEIMRVTIPTNQIATDGSFDPSALVAVGKSKGNKNMAFKNLGSMFKFQLADATGVKSVKIEANQGSSAVTLSGTAGVKFDSNGVPSHGVSKTWGPNATYVILSESKDGDQFKSNTDYFIVTRANSCPNGITVYIEYDNGAIFKRSTDKQIFPNNNTRNRIANLGILDTDGSLKTVLEAVQNFSYAGYKHGAIPPADVESLSYKVYNVTDYGAIANDGISDREAFLRTLDAALGVTWTRDNNGLVYPHKEKANAIIYFPEGEFILHDENDDIDGKSESIIIRSGNFIIKGAGRDKTIITMAAPMQPRNSALYSSPEMIQLKHYTGLSDITSVTGPVSPKGTYDVTVSSTTGLKEGDWICLYIKNKEADFVKQEVYPYNAGEDWTISKDGVEVIDCHQIKSIIGNVVTFHEPLMHEVDPNRGNSTEGNNWMIKKFPHYEEVGVEDLTFKGCAKKDFVHHGDWDFDGGYKPISMMRLTNSWIRRVGFIDISEACTILNSSNVSAYDIVMTGNRGHAAIRAQDASRVLIAGTSDKTSDGAGNYHGVGVSKHSIGTVLWRNTWGDDSCFESHANQPRATLIDCCTGGWHKEHMGGNYYEAPHHLADLTIWNFKVTCGETGEFDWWSSASWRFLPPIIVGFQSDGITFNPKQVIYDEHHGMIPDVESLYEYQLKERLGDVPQWLKKLKTINH